MTIYVAEIEGRATAAFYAQTDIEAEGMAEADWFKADLLVLESGGRPLWDGYSEIHIRETVDEERAAWESSRARAIINGDIWKDDDQNDWLTFLVPVQDPTDDE